MEAEHSAVDDNLPLAVRRPRRSIAGTREQELVKQEVDTPTSPSAPEFKTPRKRKVRFSDPVLPSPCRAGGTGLTPMVRRTSIGATPSSSKRKSMSPGPRGSLDHRVSTPAALRRRTSVGLPSSAQQADSSNSSLHSTIDGRVERRQRRDAFRARFQQLETAHQRTERQARERISLLQAQLRARDREIHELQNATIIIDTDRIYDLERQVDELQGMLDENAAQGQRRGRRSASVDSTRTSIVDWTMAARDPFGEQGDDMDVDVNYDVDDEDGFGDATIAQFACSTPSKVRTSQVTDAASSFLTPPATSPCMLPMETPAHLRFHQDTDISPPVNASAGVQAELPDPEKQMQIESLQREMDKLTSSLDAYKSLVVRLGARLPPSPDEAEAENDSSNTLEPRIENVLRTLQDRTAALTELSSSVTSLGFLGNDATEMLASIASGFRASRLELEYLTPGEIALPLTAHGAEVLDLLLERLRELARKAREGDDAIDEYHAIELNLRQQLEARVAAMDSLRAELQAKQDQLDAKTGEAEDLTVGNTRFRGALRDYERDVQELQRLVERMEADAATKDTTIEERNATVADLNARLTAAERHASDLTDELDVARASKKKHMDCINKRSGDALAQRDGRVTELRDEIDRINASLRRAYDKIHALKVSDQKLREENGGLQAVIEGMRDQLAKAEKLMERHGHKVDDEEQDGDSEQTGKYLSGGLARRTSSRKKRRVDSGLGFLDEEIIDA